MAATATPVNVLGILNTDTGCSIDTNAGGFIIEHSGLYRISYDVTFTAGAAGTEVLQGLKDGVVTLETEKGPVEVPFEEIEKARLVPKF